MIPFNNIDKTWTLFLDRDGVINHEKHMDYIHTWPEFVFYDGVIEAVAIFTGLFNRIVVVTNQKGVGKGLTSLENLHDIHANMQQHIESGGGKIDAIYFCPDLNEDSPNRKPNPGMGWMAKADFPEIDFSKSIMIGNTISDMTFGKNIGAYTVFLPTTRPDVALDDHRIDHVSDSLLDFAGLLSK